MKTRIDKNFGITGVKIDLNLPDLYMLKHTIDRIDATEKYETKYSKTGDLDALNCMLSEYSEILSNLKIFLGKITKDIQSPEDSDIFTPEKDCEDEITL